MRRVWLGLLVLGVTFVPLIHAAQQAIYIGRATSRVGSDGARSDEACAGGLAGDGTCISEETSCDLRQQVCFDVTSASGSSNTTGGAPLRSPTPSGTPIPGFPSATSKTAGQLIDLQFAQVIAGEASATADSFTGELSGSTGGAILTLGSGDGTQVIPIGGGPVGCDEPGQVLEVPGLIKLTVGRSLCKIGGGRSVITVIGTVLQVPSDGPELIFGEATAGVELPFTEGGGGAGACALSRSGQAGGGGDLLAVVGLLWLLARRRRVR